MELAGKLNIIYFRGPIDFAKASRLCNESFSRTNIASFKCFPILSLRMVVFPALAAQVRLNRAANEMDGVFDMLCKINATRAVGSITRTSLARASNPRERKETRFVTKSHLYHVDIWG